MASTTGNFESKPSSEPRSTMSGAQSAASTASDRAAEDLGKLKNDISNLADSVRKMASEKVGSTAGDVQAKAQEKLGELEGMIRKNPSQSALVAAGVGFLVGLILSR